MRICAREFRAGAHPGGGLSCAGANPGDSTVPKSADVDLDEVRNVACGDKAPDTALRQGSRPLPNGCARAARATSIMRVTIMARVGLLPKAVHGADERAVVPRKGMYGRCDGVRAFRRRRPRCRNADDDARRGGRVRRPRAAAAAAAAARPRRRVPRGHRAGDVRPGQLGVQLLFIPEEYGGMGGGAFDATASAKRWRGIDLGLATAVGHVPRQRPDHGRRHAGAEEALADAASPRRACCSPTAPPSPKPAATWARCKTTAEPRRARTARSSATGSTAASSGSATAASPTSTRSWPTRPAGRAGSSSSRAPPGFTHGKPEDKHGIRAQQHRGAVRSTTSTSTPTGWSAASKARGCVQAQAVFGYTRLMVAAFGLGAGWAALDRAIPYSTKRIQAGGAALREAGLHPQADRARTRSRLEAARAYIEETAERIDAGEGSLNTEGAIAKYLATEAGNAAADAAHPGARRLRLHARVHGREDQARRAHHHDLRGHLRDHGDDHQPRPLAAAPEDARRSTTTTQARRARGAARAPRRRSAPDVAALALHALAEVLEALPRRRG